MKAWKDSASLILAARKGISSYYNWCSHTNPFHYDYQLLCLKRHQNSSFLPGSYVFPGGMVAEADADLKWNSFFSTFGFDSNSFKSLFIHGKERPQIFEAESDNEMPREISLRITAIRETFEECGVLLCRRSTENTKQSKWATHILGDARESWQKEVHNDASQFYELCTQLHCYPDLWALHEWSNWLTPTFYPGKRYDTIFYMACMPNIPPAEADITEMDDLQWDTPNNFLSSTKVLLAPPQQYELAKIVNFNSIQSLLDFATSRSKMGVHQNFPVMVELMDGKVSVMPGDSMYPEKVSLSKRQVLDRTNITIEEFHAMSPIKNRMVFDGIGVLMSLITTTTSYMVQDSLLDYFQKEVSTNQQC